MAVNLRRRRSRRPPEFSVAQVLAWADAHHQRTGTWPSLTSGLIREALGDTWRRVDSALRYGLRGLSAGSSLARFLAEHRQVRNQGQLPPLRPKQILAWADEHRRRTGAWPTSASGPIPEAPGESWRGVDGALRVGARGLDDKSSLAQFLRQHRGVRHPLLLPRLTIQRILTWADAHHRRTGEWPTRRSGEVGEAPGESWKGIATALALGRRGLVGGSSLPRLLARYRGVRNPRQLPPLRLQQVRTWAKAHRRRTGRWPTGSSGAIPEAPGETWSAIESALFSGYRGLPAGLTFARLFGLPSIRARRTKQSKLSVARILAWADAHQRRTGAWPHSRSGPIAETAGETWRSIDQALRTKQRGLTEGGTLIRLLAERRGLHTRSYRPRLTEAQILAWARKHYRKQGAWPNFRSGPIADAPGESWRCIDHALRTGLRGLKRGRSLAQLLAERCDIRNRTNFPRLTEKQILAWAQEHYRQHRTWPTTKSGAIAQAPGETWKGVDLSLRVGYRGLRGGSSLAQLLARACGIRNRTNLPPLSVKQILAWAQDHFRQTGSWPTRNSGPVAAAPAESWHGIEMALQHGCRGLSGKSSLARLLRPHRQKLTLASRATG